MIEKYPQVLQNEETLKETVGIFKSGVQHISGLIERLRFKPGAYEMEEIGLVEVHKELNSALVSFVQEIMVKGIRFKEEYDDKVGKVKARRRHLRYGFEQMIKNSIEAIEGRKKGIGGGLPHGLKPTDFASVQKPDIVSVQKTDIDSYLGEVAVTTKAEDGWIVIEISDNGCGISEDEIDKVFNPFYTTKVHSVSNPETGTGLGLTEVYKIAEEYGGNIEIESKIDEGTKVTIKLPVAE